MIQGRVHKFGHNIAVDAIIPATFANLSDPVELGRHCMQNLDPAFVRRVKPGDIIVAGSNFGCGLSREVAPLAIQGAGISCVVAKSFSRFFFRNAINAALPVLECPEALEGTEEGDLLEIDLLRAEIKNLSRKAFFTAVPYPDFILHLIAEGGLIEYARRRLEKTGESFGKVPK